MNPDQSAGDKEIPIYGDEPDVHYTLDVVAELSGLPHRTVLYYQEKGFLSRRGNAQSAAPVFDPETLRELRRIEHLRAAFELNDAALQYIWSLLRETEQLRQESRRRLR